MLRIAVIARDMREFRCRAEKFLNADKKAKFNLSQGMVTFEGNEYRWINNPSQARGLQVDHVEVWDNGYDHPKYDEIHAELQRRLQCRPLGSKPEKKE